MTRKGLSFERETLKLSSTPFITVLTSTLGLTLDTNIVLNKQYLHENM